MLCLSHYFLGEKLFCEVIELIVDESIVEVGFILKQGGAYFALMLDFLDIGCSYKFPHGYDLIADEVE